MKRNIFDWLNEYSKYHQNTTNKLIHWVCVPLIMLSLFGLISLLNYNLQFDSGNYQINFLNIFIFVTLLFYFKLSKSLALGMFIFSLFLIYIINIINAFNLTNQDLFKLYMFIFIVSWIGQFIGHKIEGKKPAFLLLI